MVRTILDRERAYAEWARSYPPHAHNPLMEVEEAAVLRLLPPLAGCRVLDAGCGTGRYAHLAIAREASTVVALDCSQAMLSRARPLNRLVRADFVTLPFGDGRFDLVLSGLALPDVAHLSRVISEWRRVVRPGGFVLYSTLHPDGARLGWTRTFETDNGRWALPAHWHTAKDHRTACESAGLIIESIDEPTLADGTRAALVVRARRRVEGATLVAPMGWG